MIPSVSEYGTRRYRYYRCRSTAGGRPPCKGVNVPAYEMERFVRTTVVGGYQNELTPEHQQIADRLRELWQDLDEWDQIKRLGEVVSEVLFDSEKETVAVTLVEDLLELIG